MNEQWKSLVAVGSGAAVLVGLLSYIVYGAMWAQTRETLDDQFEADIEEIQERFDETEDDLDSLKTTTATNSLRLENIEELSQEVEEQLDEIHLSSHENTIKLQSIQNDTTELLEIVLEEVRKDDDED